MWTSTWLWIMACTSGPGTNEAVDAPTDSELSTAPVRDADCGGAGPCTALER